MDLTTGAYGNESYGNLDCNGTAGWNNNCLVLIENDNLDVNGSDSCPVFTENDKVVFKHFNFWVEGVVQCTVALLGLLGNFISAVILSREEMRNSFNLLLIALICFDSWFLLGAILEALRRDMTTTLHTMLFPHLLYPLQSISMSGSIFMTVGIALERYIAVHYPIGET